MQPASYLEKENLALLEANEQGQSKRKGRNSDTKEVPVLLSRVDVEMVEFAARMGGESLQDFISNAFRDKVQGLKDSLETAVKRVNNGDKSKK